jgi:acyl-CoA synthetase (AMP-forming)/AMP-acid ligase II
VSASPFLTVADAVAFSASHWPDHGYTFQNLKGEEVTYSFPAIEHESAARASALQRLGLKQGDRLALVIVEPEDFVLTFFAAIRLGVIAVPMYPPPALGDVAAYRRRTARILHAAAATEVVASCSLIHLLASLVDEIPSLRQIRSVDELRAGPGPVSFPTQSAGDTAFLQFTSGSTGDPRGVIVTHGCLLANAHAIAGPGGLDVDPRRDLGVTWLPLYHDMGLVGFVVAAMCVGVSVVFIPTLRFLRHPAVWMETIHRHRATISFGPNFSYALVTRQATPERLQRLDLSCVRVLGCGGEPVNPDVIRAFTDVFHERAGLPPDVVRPAYGLAEGTLMTTLTPDGQGLKTLRVDAGRFQEDRIVEPARDGRMSLEHVSVGRVISDHEVIIADEVGLPLPDGHEGHVLVRGPSVTPGYFNDPDGSAQTFRNGTLQTGDLGYVHEGSLYITGRSRDLIIHNGRNIHPQAIEWVVEQVEGSRRGHVVAVSVPGGETERIVVAMETRAYGDGQAEDALVSRVKTAVQRELSLPLADVVCLRRGELPMTSSGKVQRQLTRQQYLAGGLGANGTKLVGRAKRTGARIGDADDWVVT